ncbi:hypothetical protein PSP6_350006 [Paraburkholderia tropica]|nr:hypothetical protein PSP6_350006 [Paraburkholderia tropica]
MSSCWHWWASLGIARDGVIGHSTGGMLALCYGLMDPRQAEQRVLLNPIGIEDWTAQGGPFAATSRTTITRVRGTRAASLGAGGVGFGVA